MSQTEAKPPQTHTVIHEVDLTSPRLVSLEEVARLFGLTEKSIRGRLMNRRFPVRPKLRKPFRWSSVELREWIEDSRRRGNGNGG